MSFSVYKTNEASGVADPIMAINRWQVFKRETFTLVGADGSTYYLLCPRDTSLPVSESINCHCLMDEVDVEWATNHAGDKIKIILDMNEEDQIRFFGEKKDRIYSDKNFFKWCSNWKCA